MELDRFRKGSQHKERKPLTMKTWTGVELTCPEALADELAAQAAQLFQVAVEVNGDRVLSIRPGNGLRRMWKGPWTPS